MKRFTRFGLNLLKALNQAAIGFVTFAAVVWSVFFLLLVFQQNAPDRWWVEYDGVTAFTKYTAGDKPRFFSESRYPRGGKVTWNDVMRCDTNGDGKFDFFSSYVSSAVLEPRNAPKVDNGWVYQGNVPNKSAACFVESTIEVKTSRGAIKKDHIKTDIFYFVESQGEVITPR